MDFKLVSVFAPGLCDGPAGVCPEICRQRCSGSQRPSLPLPPYCALGAAELVDQRSYRSLAGGGGERVKAD